VDTGPGNPPEFAGASSELPTMIGMVRVWAAARTRVIDSKPSMPGIRKSVTRTGNSLFLDEVPCRAAVCRANDFQIRRNE
jgi:hypothetical protein